MLVRVIWGSNLVAIYSNEHWGYLNKGNQDQVKREGQKMSPTVDSPALNRFPCIEAVVSVGDSLKGEPATLVGSVMPDLAIARPTSLTSS